MTTTSFLTIFSRKGYFFHCIHIIGKITLAHFRTEVQHKRCAFPGCEVNRNLSRIQKNVRSFAAKNTKIYIHRFAKACYVHSKARDWLQAMSKIPTHLERRKYSSEQIEDLINLLTDKKIKSIDSVVESNEKWHYFAYGLLIF